MRELLAEIGGQALATADPALKAEVYGDLGIRLIYRPADRVVSVEAVPGVGASSCRRGDLNPHALAGTSPSS